MTKDSERKRTGRLGEDEACRFLMERGQTVLDRNWRSGHYEIDIVTLDDAGIHFVEVKTRRPPVQAAPEESVNYVKQKRLVAAAGSYLRRKDSGRLALMECFFDVVSVVFGEDGTRLEYFPQAFVPLYFGK